MKTIVVSALAYGGGAWGIAEKQNITLEAAEKLMRNYFDTFPGIERYIRECQLYTDKHGEIPDMVGRKRRFKFAGWINVDKAEKYYEEGFWRNGMRIPKQDFRRDINSDKRASTNFPIQGLAASMTKISGNNITRLVREMMLMEEIKLIEFVHDIYLSLWPGMPR